MKILHTFRWKNCLNKIGIRGVKVNDTETEVPNPAIYKLACNRLKLKSDAVVFVGDGGSDELRGAAACGLKPIWATWFIEAWHWDWRKKVVERSNTFPRCRSIADLPALIDCINRYRFDYKGE